jgi:hypothetical protein
MDCLTQAEKPPFSQCAPSSTCKRSVSRSFWEFQERRDPKTASPDFSPQIHEKRCNPSVNALPGKIQVSPFTHCLKPSTEFLGP